MLPYTPLHYLLLEHGNAIPEAWVMTSGNASDEPILSENDEALEKLADVAKAFLLHDRPIEARIDDSVVRMEPRTCSLISVRRARGYAPEPIRLPWQSAPMLAAGAELKSTLCLAQDQYAFISPHIGDLKTYETQLAYERSIAHYQQLFKVKPGVIVHDLHPDYQSTRYALERAEGEGLQTIGVQHHHAHIAACMAEHGLPAEARVIGFAFDGIGYGTDGAIWGGEVLVGGYRQVDRSYHLDYIRMPGGDLAVKEPWRMAFAWLHKIGYDWQSPFRKTQLAGKFESIRQQLETGINAPLTSSMGRLFDAVAALVGLRGEVSYEGQAAIELENRSSSCEEKAYRFEINESTFSADPVVRGILADLKSGLRVGQIAARFHNGVANLVLDLAVEIKRREGLNDVVLSGGVWQNMTLLLAVCRNLESAGFQVYTHHQVAANDGGISLGQIAVAHHALNG
jgi:hydrogenase maturation protein HypF